MILIACMFVFFKRKGNIYPVAEENNTAVKMQMLLQLLTTLVYYVTYGLQWDGYGIVNTLILDATTG